ncbi:hypothetical protein [Arthrobacter sp. Soil782]|uniref:hypothetical protein n=1 Tax=Arthrobacter sp. Soil782 TaxID=1736410 RepID=UPI0012FB54FC|nr:hypothetical protein [Arthrobacter sp. Soil782]
MVIVEPNFTGHRLYYVRLLVEEAARRGNDVFVILTEEAIHSAEYEVQLAPLIEQFRLRFLPQRGTPLDLIKLRELSVGLVADVLVVPDGDGLARKMATSVRWRGPGTLNVLVLREKAQSNRIPGRAVVVNIAKWLIHHWADRASDANIVLLKTALWQGRSSLTTANDPVTLRVTAQSVGKLRDEWGLTTPQHWFSVLGFVDKRKNLPLVLRSLSGLKSGRRIGLLIAGKCAPEVLEESKPFLGQLRAAGAKVVLLDRFLTENELDSAVAAVDTVVMAHSNEGSSGLFGKAVAAGTGIVAGGAKTLRRELAASPGLGEWAPLNQGDLSVALKRALDRRGPGHPRALGTDSFTSPLLGGR